MNLAGEQKAYDAAAALAHELPYWGWLPNEPFCLTRSGELLAVARLQPATLDGKTPEQLDQILNRWQRLLSQLPDNTRFYFYLLRRPATLPPIDGLAGVAAISQERRRQFLERRVAELQTYVAWAHNPNLSQASKQAGGGLRSLVDVPLAWIRTRQNPGANTYLRGQVEDAARRFGQIVEASRALVDDVTPVTLLKPGPATAFLSELINRPGLPAPPQPAASGLNWRLALSELEAERRHLRLDDEPVLLYSLLSPPVQGRANLLHDLLQLDAQLTISIEWRPKATQVARAGIRRVQRAHFSKRYSAAAHMQETDGTAGAMADATAVAESERLADALVELEADGIAYGDPLAHPGRPRPLATDGGPRRRASAASSAAPTPSLSGRPTARFLPGSAACPRSRRSGNCERSSPAPG